MITTFGSAGHYIFRTAIANLAAANGASMRHLALPGFASRKITDSSYGVLALLAHFPALQHLDLSRGSSKHDDQAEREIMDALEALSQLTHLDLSGRQDLSGSALKPLSTLTELRCDCCACLRILLHADQQCNAFVPHRHSACACRYLSLSACRPIEDKHLSGLLALPHLNHLSLAGCELLTDATLEALTRCARLTRLELRAMAVTDAGLAALLPALTALRYLGLERCAATRGSTRSPCKPSRPQQARMHGSAQRMRSALAI